MIVERGERLLNSEYFWIDILPPSFPMETFSDPAKLGLKIVHKTIVPITRILMVIVV